MMTLLSQPTPLILSHPLSQLTGLSVYLKMEALQPSGSFKDRGIGALCRYAAQKKALGFISSSGGNAGLAVAYASKALNLPAKIVLPTTTAPLMLEKIQKEGVEIIVHGNNWDEADLHARTLVQQFHYAYIPPFDHPIIWEGYAGLIHEIQHDQLKPDAILVAVGGGGLFSGVVQGLYEVGYNQDTAIITAETEGKASFALSVAQKKRIQLDKIDSIAVTLGAKQICERAFHWSQIHPVFPQVVTDKEAIQACIRFADDHHILVEPACGASLACVYKQLPVLQQFKSLVVIVCGGSGISLELLKTWSLP